MTKERNALPAGRVVVVGAGIAGIFSALLHAEKGLAVTLVEGSDECGGLLRSFRNENGAAFDWGTHVLRPTGNAPLDKLLLQGLDLSEWHHMDRLKTGNFFNNSLNELSQYIDLRSLPEEQRDPAIRDLLESEDHTAAASSDAFVFACLKFGRSIAEDVIRPVIERLFGLPMDQLHPSCLTLAGHTRIIAFDAEHSRELKGNPLYDEKIAFTSWNEGLSGSQHYYPHDGGIQRWTDTLLARLAELDVEVLVNTTVSSISKTGDTVRSVVLSSGRRIDTDQLHWAISPVILLRALGTALPEGIAPPEFRSSALIHYEFDAPFRSDLYYLYCNQPEMLSFRVTLYPNLRGSPGIPDRHNCTVEVLGDRETTTGPDLSAAIHQEIVRMGLIPQSARILYEKTVSLPNGFPIPTLDFQANSQKLARHCELQADNIRMFGRSTGKNHFIQDVISEIWESSLADHGVPPV